jgi:hypothetical protein
MSEIIKKFEVLNDLKGEILSEIYMFLKMSCKEIMYLLLQMITMYLLLEFGV